MEHFCFLEGGGGGGGGGGGFWGGGGGRGLDARAVSGGD